MKSSIIILTIMAVVLQPAFVKAQYGTLGRTSWGSWGDAEHCENGTHATAFRLKVHTDQGSTDDTGLNGVQFRCSSGQILTSKSGPLGEWGSWHTCPSGEDMKGVSFQSQPSQGIIAGRNMDDAAGSNLRAQCSGGSWLKGEGLNLGSWDSFSCRGVDRICGLQTQVEDHTGDGDETGLNRINVLCCHKQERPQPCPIDPLGGTAPVAAGLVMVFCSLVISMLLPSMVA